MKTNLKKLLSLCLAGLLTAGMTVAASAISVSNVVTDNEHPSYLAKYSVDGDDTQFWHTNWEAGQDELPFVLTYELDGTYEISSIGLLPRQDSNLNGLIYIVNINVSLDGVNFTTAEEVDWLEYTQELQTIELKTPVTAKYLQLEILETETYTNGSLNQLYINGELITLSDDAKAAEEAAAAAAEAARQAELAAALAANGFKSVVADNEHASYLAVYAGDGNPEKFWHTDWTNPEVTLPLNITFELDNLYNVTELTLTPRPDAQADGNAQGSFIDFNIYGSVDGENFTLAQTVTGLTPDTQDKTVVLDQPMTTGYIRLEITNAFSAKEGEVIASLNQLAFVGTVAEETAAAETEAPAVETEAEVVETEAPAVETEAEIAETEAPVVETEVVEAPQTSDGALLVILAVVSSFGLALVSRKVRA